MKLAFIRARYQPYGGAERFVTRALTTLADQGHSLSIIARSWDIAAEEPWSKSIEFLRCDPPFLGRVSREAGFARAVQTLLSQHPFDLVQSHERIPGVAVYRAGDGVHAAWLERRAQQQSRPAAWLTRKQPLHRYLLATERAMFTHPNLRTVICNSRLVYNELQERFQLPDSQLALIYNGVDTERFHPRAALDRTRLRSAWGIPQTAPCLLFVGSGFERKGLRCLLQAQALCPEVWLVVVGYDKHQRQYQRQAAQLGLTNRVIFAGAQSNVLPFYGAADAFVLPTWYDPFPNAVLEALACGVPVITSDACGAAELLAAEAVVAAGDAPALAQAIQHQLYGADCAVQRAHARSLAEPFTLERLQLELLGLYARLGQAGRG